MGTGHGRVSKMAGDLRFNTVLIANRGEIAVRLIRGVHSLGLRAAAIYTSADRLAPHVRLADVAVALGDDPTAYTDIKALLAAVATAKADAVLPGYGFISENPRAAAAFESAKVTWVGPTPAQITQFASKTDARALAVEAGVAVVPGSPPLADESAAEAAAVELGFPVLVKAAEGGGGMGQAAAYNVRDVARAFRAVRTQADSLFGGGAIFLERFVEHARHVEVQVFGDGRGNVAALGLRDCSVQRRRQKVLEEGPPPELPSAVTQVLADAAVKLCAKYNYQNAGTVEFVVDATSHEWFFLEVNTRLQVEHGVTELTSGVDIVQWMLLQAGDVDVLGTLMPNGGLKETGYAIEARIYAENPVKEFAPSPGVLSEMVWPTEGCDSDTGGSVRVDSWASRGASIPPNYDPLLGKVLAHGKTRAIAIATLANALKNTILSGVSSNIELLLQVLENESFVVGKYTTSLLKSFPIKSSTVEVLAPGVQSSLQDFPGRVGYWNIGVSPSGAMDLYAMNVANALVGNPLGACALEMTVKGATLKFHTATIVALTGCRFRAEIDDGKPVPWWTPFSIEAGSVLEMDGVTEVAEDGDDDVEAQFKLRVGGKIGYIAVRGGFDAPKYLGSASTFPTGNFGGVHGRFLKSGDFLPLKQKATLDTMDLSSGWPLGSQLPDWLIPSYSNDKERIVGALNGPHASEDFLHEESIRNIWNEPYKVHHAANRLGVRLIGPAPKWTRKDGGSAGLHPSNLHDYTYAPGAVNFSGNTPIVLMLDGPSLGGFVCPITVASAEMWKVAQAVPGSMIRFRQVSYDDARNTITKMNEVWDAIRIADSGEIAAIGRSWTPEWVRTIKPVDKPAIISSLNPGDGENAEIKVVYRVSGDEHLLVEYGDIKLDLAYRMRVHMLMEVLKKHSFVKELCPGVRSLLVRYDANAMHIDSLVSFLVELEQGALGSVHSLVVPSRVIHLPLAFNCRWTKDALERYQRSVRPEAPYLPSNVEFVRRINGLSSIDEVRDIMLTAEYCVMGLGDVYLGAPCAVPIDPRHRLVTSKMAPARLFTHEGTVGIGGSYMCIYGMDSPGGYQLMGRTLPIWDSFGSIPETHRGAPPAVPWLLRFFDRVRFYLVSDDELEELRERYRRGEVVLDIREETFSYAAHLEFCRNNASSIEQFASTQQAAFEEERGRWEASGEADSDAAAAHAARDNAGAQEHAGEDEELAMYAVRVRAGVAGSVWAVHVGEGERVEAGQELMALESMKIELGVDAPVGGVVLRVSATKGDNVAADDTLMIIQSSREAALADMSLTSLRTMYKLGVLTPASAAMALRDTTDSSLEFNLTRDSNVDKALAAVHRATGRRYLALRGAPYVCAAPPNTPPPRVLDALNAAGALHIASTTVSVVDVVAGRGAPFSVGFNTRLTPRATSGVVAVRYGTGGGTLEVCATCAADVQTVVRVLGHAEDAKTTRRIRIGVVEEADSDVMAVDMAVAALQRGGAAVQMVADAAKALDETVDVLAFVAGNKLVPVNAATTCVLSIGASQGHGMVLVADGKLKSSLLEYATMLS